ncbi:MAG: DUF1549 domain-containing protein, partial [Planctomycetales bacterium]|nr:DUF1549 domain-containing protein [Planctomycetales bacterium]
GERWGRHWMDVWRYSDWYGRRSVPDVWNSAPQIWRWRDWIVRSLNDDAGYDHMLRMMLAADEIAPDDDQAAVATGFLIRNWYALNPNDWMRNNVEHTAKAMLGLTFNCAHCHDHKYDPITHEDYFRFRAFFETIGIRQDRVAGEADPGPFQEYDYSTLRKVVRIGSVSVFDKQPDAPTWFYTGGDERNRLTERGSIRPGLPAVFGDEPVAIERTELPPVAWYPGLRPSIQQTELADAERKIELAGGELTAARAASDAELPALLAAETKAAAEFDAAAQAARAAGESNAIAGRQSLLLDATTGRRILNLELREVDSLQDGDQLRFQLRLLTNTHFNFQLARDAVKGLTAGYVAFDAGRIWAYEPGSFREFEIGRYDFAAGQTRFDLEWKFHPDDDTATLRIVCVGEKPATGDAATGVAVEPIVLVEGTRVAINGWNPVGDPTKTITFDAHTGSVAAIDQIEWLRAARRTPPVADSAEASRAVVLIDFESPAYAEGRDVVGRHGWSASSFCQSPATSIVSATIGNSSLSEQAARLRAASRAVEAVKLRVTAAEAAHAAAEASRASVAARIAADNAQYRGSLPEDVRRSAAKFL